MKEVIFKKIKIWNFLSVGTDPLEVVFHKGINIITGINYDKDSRNGVGKSTIADALYWVCFGNTLRELKKEEIVNNVTKKNCKVVLTFDVNEEGKTDEYVLMRKIEPTKIQLMKNGVDVTKSTIPKTTEEICRIINASPEVFENSVIMSLNSTVPFMAQKKTEKRKFIEGVLKLTVFSDMLLASRQDYNELKSNHEIQNARVNESENTLSIYRKQQEKEGETKSSRVEELRRRQASNTEEIEALSPKIVAVTKKEFNAVQKEIDEVIKQDREATSEIKAMIKDIASLKADVKHKKARLTEIEEVGDVCVLCKRAMDEHDKGDLEKERTAVNTDIAVTVKKIALMEKSLDALEDNKTKLKSEIEQKRQKYHQLELNQQETENFKTRLNQLEAWNKQIERDIKSIQSEKSNFKELIAKTEAKLAEVSRALQDVKTKLANLEVVKFVVSEEGVKSFIVKRILKMLNTRLGYYLQLLDSNCICFFNEYFEEVIVNDKGQECSYMSFSGGERKRIDLAMLFTFQDIRRLQADVSININIYDELLDSAIDEKGAQLVLNILKDRVEKYGEAIYVISHQKAIMNVDANSVVMLEKRNGFTRLMNTDAN